MKTATAGRVLVVEDNAGDFDLVREILADSYVVDNVERIAGLLDWLRSAGKPDLIILDLSLPDAFGLEALEHARALAADVPVVVLTGSSESLLGAQAVQRGAEDYLTKQEMTRQSLLRSVSYAMERHRSRQRERVLIAEQAARVEAERTAEALRASEERLAAIIGTAMDAIITVDEDQRVVLFNTAAEKMFRHVASEVIGHPLERLIPERFRAAHRRHIQRFGATGETSRSMHSIPTLFGKRSDGEEFPCEATISQVTAGKLKLYTVILRDITERIRAEELRRLSVDLLEVRDQERRHVASQLHESIGQSLSALGLLLSSTRSPALARGDEVQRFLDEARALVQQCSSDIQSMAYVLYPLALDNLGLAAAIRSYVRDYTECHGIEVDLEITPELARLPSEHELVFFRVLEEALTNVQRHSGSKTASVRVFCDALTVGLEVTDEGPGGSPLRDGAAMDSARGRGIPEMRERMRSIGGRLEVISENRGTTVRALLPVAAREPYGRC
jgi:PAS domain S-box-containing protein